MPRPTRRLTDKILLAFHSACDQGELEIAARLLHCCEIAMRRPPPPGRDRRRNVETLVAAYERLWFLRHPEATRDDAIPAA